MTSLWAILNDIDKETAVTTRLTADGRIRVLADGQEMPMLGLGVWQVPNGAECVNAVRWALELGYRHIDTAQAYENEESVGKALRESGIPREEVFLTTKFSSVRGAGSTSLKTLALHAKPAACDCSTDRFWEASGRAVSRCRPCLGRRWRG